jgi:PAS domain S-box-containing protein
MTERTDRAYRDHIAANLARITEILAHMSFGDYRDIPAGELLEDREFGEIYCAFNLLVDDLRESRRNLEDQVRRRTEQLHHDIEMRKAVERTLRQSEQRHRALIEMSPDAIVALDLSFSIVMANEAAVRMYGAESADELIGKGSRDLIDPADHDRVSHYMREAFERGITPLINYTFLRKDRSRFPGEISVALLQDPDGAPGGFIGVIRDCAERHRLEAEAFRAQKLESLGTLAGGIAHDFNNILTGIISNVAMARAEIGRETAAGRMLDDAERAAVRASGLTRQLLTFSKGGAPLIQTIEPGKMIREAVRFCLSGTNVRCTPDIADDLWHIRADAAQIDQALHNLLINAVQAMPTGGPLEVEARNVVRNERPEAGVAPGRYVQIRITDHGVGIPAENIPRIFDPYFSTKARGSGLGLATAYSVATRHHGSIDCCSEVDRGATFTLCVPAAAAPPERASAPAAPEAVSGARILVMDDDAAVRMVMVRVLEWAGHVAVGVSDGRAALKEYRSALDTGAPFDLAIMDLTIQGGEGGVETLARMREIDPAVHAIVVSGYSSDHVLSEYASFGFQARISKPFLNKEFTATVNRVLGDAGTERPGSGQPPR